MSTSLRIRLLGLAAVALAALAGAPPVLAARSADDILRSAREAALAAHTVHVTGRVPTGGQDIGLDLRLVDGRGATGSIVLDGARADLRVIGTAIYVRATKPFLVRVAKQPANGIATQVLVGRWFRPPAGGAGFSDFVALTDMGKLLTETLDPGGPIRRMGTATVAGVPAVLIGDSSGVLAVSRRRPPYPLELRPPSGAGRVAFTDWNAPVRLVTPPHVLDLSHQGARG
jgi:hypothetical protein